VQSVIVNLKKLGQLLHVDALLVDREKTGGLPFWTKRKRPQTASNSIRARPVEVEKQEKPPTSHSCSPFWI
jgi:hypothetical protein